MKIVLIILCILFLNYDTSAFFWGKPDYSKARLMLEEMHSAFKSDNCSIVLYKYEEFLKEKPPLSLKKDAYLYAGECYEKMKDLPSAVSVYKLAAELYPKDEIFLKKASSLYLDSGLYQSALNFLKKLEKMRPYDSQVWLMMARAWKGLGFVRKAVHYYRRLAASNTEDYKLLKEYLIALRESGSLKEGYELAIKGYNESKDPDFAIIAAEMRALSGNLKSALSLLNSLENSGNCSLKCRKMAAVYNFFDSNISACQKQLEFTSQDEDFTSFMRGILSFNTGDKKSSILFFKKSSLSEDTFIREASENFLKRMAQ